MSPAALDRFVTAQAASFDAALGELRAGTKRSHWMWFIFPQIAGLGQSDMARRYAIADRAEARAYLDHALLGPRLRTCTEAVLGWVGKSGLATIFGGIDALKFRSSMTLFEAVGNRDGDMVFTQALEAMCGGERDPLTLALLNGPAPERQP
ncbi:MAG: DUF1810 domain-containing protein [Novosphingobium sp.]